MNNPDRARLRAAQLQLRAAHRTIFDLQGQAISGLRKALEAVERTHKEIMGMFDTFHRLDDAIERNIDTP